MTNIKSFIVKLFRNGILLSLILGVLFFIYCILTVSDYNTMWDGRNHFYKGQAFANFFLSGETNYNNLQISKDQARYYRDYAYIYSKIDVSKKLSSDPNYRRSIYQNQTRTFDWLMKVGPFEHPVLSDTGAAFFNIIFYQKLGIVRDDHAYALFGIFLASILVATIFFWAIKAYGLFMAVISSIVLITTPLFLAESHYNIKDIPLLSFFSLSVFTFWWAVKKYSLKWMFVSAILGGLALGTKFNALFLPVILYSWFFFHFLTLDKIDRSKYLKWWWVIFAFPLIMFAVLTAGWPQMWKNPIGGFFNIISYYKTVGLNIDYTPAFRTIFNISTYPSVWIFYATYPFVILFSIVGVVGFIRRFKKTKDTLPLLFIIWFLVTLVRASLPNTSIFGGVRHIIEYIPALSLLSGYGAYFLITIAKDKWVKIFKVIIILSFIPFIITLIKLYPYQNVYFNSFIGGLAGAKNAKLAGWGNTDGGIYEVAVKWLNKNAEKNSHIAVGFSETADFYIPEFRQDLLADNQFSGYLQKGEYIVALTHDSELEMTYRMLYAQNFLKPVYVYSVEGVPLVKIWKNEKKYLRDDVKDLTQFNLSVVSQKDGAVLMWDLGREEKIFSIKLEFDRNNQCKDLAAGYFQISKDRNNWIVLPETYPITVIDAFGEQPKDNVLTDPVAGITGRYVWFIVDPDSACILNTRTATVGVLR